MLGADQVLAVVAGDEPFAGRIDLVDDIAVTDNIRPTLTTTPKLTTARPTMSAQAD